MRVRKAIHVCKRRVVTAVSILLLGPVCLAGTCTWTGDGDGTSWSDLDNWKGKATPAAGDEVILSAATSGATIQNDLGDLSIGRLTFQGSNALTLTSAGTITLTGLMDGSYLKVMQNNCTAAVTVEAPLALTELAKVNLFGLSGSSTTLTLKGTVSGTTGGIWFSGNASTKNKVILKGDNSYVGQTRFSFCSLRGDGTTAFGAAGNEIWYSGGGGNLSVTAPGTYAYAYTPYTEAGTALSFDLTGAVEWTGPIVLSSSAKTYVFGVGVNVTTLTLSGIISGAGGLKFNANSSTGNAVHLTGDNTYKGPTLFSCCKLYADSTTAFGDATNMISCVAGSGALMLTVPGKYVYGFTPHTEGDGCMKFSGAGDFEWAGPIVLTSATKTYRVISPVGTTDAPRTLTISGQISGDGKIRVGGDSSTGQLIVFSGDNSHAGTVFAKSCVKLTHTNAVGRAEAALVHDEDGSGYMRLDQAGVWNCDIRYGSASWQELGLVPGTTINGKVYGADENVFGQLTVRSAGHVYIRDGFDMPGKRRFYPLLLDSAYVHLCAPSTIGGGFYSGGTSDWHGWMVFDAAGNRYGALNLSKTVNVRCGTTDALDTTNTVNWAGQMSSSGAYLDLNGYSQHALALESDEGETGRYLRSGSASATLYLEGATQDYSTHALIQSGVSLVWNPSGAYTQTLVNRTHTMDGSITVSNGTFRASGTATLKALKAIVVEEGAAFDLATTSSAALVGLTNLTVRGGTFTVGTAAATPFGEATVVYLDATAVLALPADTTCSVAELWVWKDGGYRQIGSGAYTHGDIPQITGGTLNVAVGDPEIEEIAWDAGAGEDQSVAAWDNWDDGEEHDLTSGWVLPTFASAGTAADIDRAVTFKGVRFDGAATAFDLTGAGSMSLLEQGVTVASARTNAIAVPVALKPFRGTANQTWNVGANAVLTMRAPITSSEAVQLGKAGTGTLELTEPSDFLGNFSHTGGVLVVSAPSNGCGKAVSDYELFVNERTADYGGTRFCNTIVNRPVRIWGNSDLFGALCFFEGTNVFNGKVTFAYTTRPRTSNGSTVIFNGGIYSGNYLTPASFGSQPCDWIVRTKPMTCNEGLELGQWLHVILEVAGNSVKSGISMHGSDCRLDLRVDQAFASPVPVAFGSDAAKCKLLLNGHDLSVKTLEEAVNAKTLAYGTGVIDSSEPATLTVTAQSLATTLKGVDLTGKLSLSKAGTYKISVDRILSATGALDVVSGPFAFTENGRWPNCTNVTVRAGATLSVARSDTFKKKLNVTVETDGALTLSDGVVLPCRGLCVGGQLLEPGTYGGPDSAAEHKLSCFSGSGVLKSSGLHPGFSLFIR